LSDAPELFVQLGTRFLGRTIHTVQHVAEFIGTKG
jgi:hypothetical protein